MALFSWTIWHHSVGQYGIIQLDNMASFSWTIWHHSVGQYGIIQLDNVTVNQLLGGIPVIVRTTRQA